MHFCDGEYKKNVIENRLKMMGVTKEEPAAESGEKKPVAKKETTKLASNLSLIMAGLQKKNSQLDFENDKKEKK